MEYQASAHPPRRVWLRAVVWTVTGLLVLGVASTLFMPRLGSRDSPPRAKCASDLHQIGLAILLYQQDYAGQYPDTLGRLIETEQIGAEVFVCPSSDDVQSTSATTRAIADDVTAGPPMHHCSYIYVGRGLTDKTVKDTTVVAYEPLTNHEGSGSNVLFGDGHADWRTPTELAALVKSMPTSANAR